jgi:hypothetical protein
MMMDITMSLSYKFLTEPKEAPGHVLNTLAHWIELKEYVSEVYEECSCPKGG